MRWQNGPSTCAYGLPGQGGYLFAHSRSALRQSTFMRGRTTTKRKHCDDQDGDAAQQFDPAVALDGIKRLRVESPPTSSPSSPRAVHDYSTHHGEPDVAMEDESNDARDALVVVKTAEAVIDVARSAALKYRAPLFDHSTTQLPASAPCTAMIVFAPPRPLPVERAPKIEFVDSDDEQAYGFDDGNDSEEEPFVRFEEILDEDEQGDEAEAMELD